MSLPQGFKAVPFADAHRTFVLTTWLDTYYDSYAAGTFEWRGELGYESVYRPSFEKLLARPGVRCDVVVLAEDERLFLGWCLTQRCEGYGRRLAQPVLHYVYVKGPYRRSGIAKALFQVAGLEPRREFRHSHKTKDWERITQEPDPDIQSRTGRVILRRKAGYDGMRYDPTLARYPTPPREWKETADAR